MVFLPSGESFDLPTAPEAHFLHLAEQGIYEIRPPGADDDRPQAVAVNVDLTEAELAPLDVEAVVASLSARATAEVSNPREGTRAARLRLEDQERRQSIWRFLLLAALMLLVVETVVSNRISRVAGKRGYYEGA